MPKISERKTIIVTADDFGKNEKASLNILWLLKKGKLDRVSVMINEPLGPELVRELLDSGIKIDIHLQPVAKINDDRQTQESVLKRGALFTLRYLWGSAGRAATEKGWTEQIEKFIAVFGRRPDGLNSHQHIHFFPPYFRIAVDLAEKFGIPHLRFGKKSFIISDSFVFKILNYLRKTVSGVFPESSLDSYDYFVSADWLKDVGKFIENLPDGSTEISCHPEREDELGMVEKYF